jgi:hypothetical protein
MSTRSTIGYVEDEKLYQVYCHFDGYISWNGSRLVNFYNSLEKVKELLSYGHISSLEKTIEKSKFYHRDREEDLEQLTVSTFSGKTLTGFVPEWQEEFDYIFFNNSWYVFDIDIEKWKRLTPNIVKLYN